MKGAISALILALAISSAASEVVGGGNLNADLLSALANIANAFNGPDHIKDTVIYGRAMRITETDGTCVTVQDRNTGFKSSKCADTAVLSTQEATNELVTLLIKLGQMSYDDIGLKPTAPKPVARDCADNFSQRKCDTHLGLGHCDPSNRFFNWIHENCYKTCGGCMSREEVNQALGGR